MGDAFSVPFILSCGLSFSLPLIIKLHFLGANTCKKKKKKKKKEKKERERKKERKKEIKKENKLLLTRFKKQMSPCLTASHNLISL